MTQTYVPTNWPSVITRLSLTNPEEAVNFLRSVFAAEGEFNRGRPSEMRIDDSLHMVAGTVDRAATASFLYVYVPDVDASFDRALALGAESMEAPAEMPDGDSHAPFPTISEAVKYAGTRGDLDLRL